MRCRDSATATTITTAVAAAAALVTARSKSTEYMLDKDVMSEVVAQKSNEMTHQGYGLMLAYRSCPPLTSKTLGKRATREDDSGLRVVYYSLRSIPRSAQVLGRGGGQLNG